LVKFKGADPIMAKDDYWIQDAIKRKGALTQYVYRKYGKSGFTVSRKTGKLMIKQSVLNKLAKEKGTTGRRARLAITLRKLPRH
jgi:hypothetical protein